MDRAHYLVATDGSLWEPRPGSIEAIRLGCQCPVLENQHGKGALNKPDGAFWIVEDCPLHILELG